MVGIDHIQELVDWARSNVEKGHPELLASGRIKFVVGDGRKGYPADGPYDAIHVGAAADTLPKDVSSYPPRTLFFTKSPIFYKKPFGFGFASRSWWSSWRRADD